jgi:hypothetical protein
MCKMNQNEARQSAKRDREMAAIKEAWADGKKVEWFDHDTGRWEPLQIPTFSKDVSAYRIAKDNKNTFKQHADGYQIIIDGHTMFPDDVCRKLNRLDYLEAQLSMKTTKEKSFRPFKDYEEFKPYRERFVVINENGWCIPAWYYALSHGFEWCFKNVKFENGEPFGIKE